jgi:hypothetical protein
VKRIKRLLISGLITFLLLEVSLALASHAGLLNIIMPTYSLPSSEDLLPERSFLYGYRHKPGGNYEIKKNCLHNYYQFNELGFRDKLPSKKDSNSRVIVLGDSFMEGIGVAEEERLSDLLEKESGIAHLNFAMADKGPTQSYVIYDALASTYPHEAVLLALFPTNDLIDDDPNIGKNEASIRPCWVGEAPDYQLAFVPEEAPARKESNSLKHFLKRFTYTYDALHYLKESIKYSLQSKDLFPPADYYHYSEAQISRLKHSLMKIKEKAGDRSLIVVCIPSSMDLNSTAERESIEKELKVFCEKQAIEFIGLGAFFKQSNPEADKQYYYSCDMHWNPEGHKAAMEAVLRSASYYQALKQ